MALKKPSDFFNKKEASVVFESSEISSNITETYDRFRDNLDKVNALSEQIEYLSQQLSEKMTRTDLENAMLSNLMVLDENFKSIRNQVKGLNKEDLKEFKVNISNLTAIVGNLVENELPKYKKQVTKNEVRIGDKFEELKEVVEENIIGIKEEIDSKVNDIAEVIDSNLEYFNNQLQETSTEVKKTTDTYNKLSKIVESKVLKENEKLEEYSQVIQSLYESFVELEVSLQEQTSTYSQIIEEKFETISSVVKDKINSIDEDVDTFKNQVSSDISSIKADVVINEQHIKNVDKYLQEHHQELVDLKEEVFDEIEKLPLGNLQENLERLEKKIDYIKETYSKIEPEVIVKEVIKEGLLNEPPDTKNSDPLTPLDQKFVTLDQLQEHYRLFINRIQQQLSTFGGGGETRLEFLDDIDRNSAKVNGRFLKYDAASGKWIGALGGGGGSQTLDDTLQLGNTSSIGMSVGIVTATGANITGNVTLGASSSNLINVPGRISSNFYPDGDGLYDVGRPSQIGLGANRWRNANFLGIGKFDGGVDAHDLELGVGSSNLIYSTSGNLELNSQSGKTNIDDIVTISGNTGIGTANPTSKLHVIGDARITGILTIGTASLTFDGTNNTIKLGSGTTISGDGGATYAGIVTATAFVGDGSGLTNLPGSSNSGYANTAGIATYANTSGFSTFSGYSNRAGIATYANTSGIATYSNAAGVSTFSGYSNVAGIATYATSAGIATYSTNAGIATYATNAGIATYATNAGVSTFATSAGIATYATSSGIATYATNAGIATYATNAGIATEATRLQNARTFQITGDIVGAAVSFDGTGNVSIAATIQPNSVGLGTDTTGDYVQSITGTSNQISVSVTSGEGSTPTLSIPNQFTVPQDLTVIRDVQINRNLNVTGNITIGGTSAYILAESFRVSDSDIVLGFRTDAFGNDVSNDTTANHGGVALASTEGFPLVNLNIVGIETFPPTYKKIMWFKSGSFAGLNTDAWLTNYAFGVGTTQMPDGARFAAGNFVVGQDDITSVRNINSTGIITATSFVGPLTGNAATATYAELSGIATYSNTSGIATYTWTSGVSTYSGVSGFSTFSGYSNIAGVSTYATSSGIATYATSAGIATFATNADIATYAELSGIATYSNTSGIATYAELSGISTNVIGGIGSITQLNVSGVGSISIINGNTLDIVGDTNLYNANLVGITTLGFFSDVFYLNKSVKLEENTKYYTVHKQLFVGAGHSLTIGDGASITVDRFNNLDDVNADSLTINGNTLYGSSTSTTNSISTVGIHSSLATANYRSVEYTIQVTRGTNFHVTKILALHNNTLAYSSEYGTIFNNSSLATFDVDVSGGNMRLLVTPVSSLSTQYKINFIAIKI